MSSQTINMTLSILKKTAYAILFLVTALNISACDTDSHSNQVRAIEDLCKARVGVQIGTTVEIATNEYLEQHNCPPVERFNSFPDSIAALTQGKLDAVVMDELPAVKFVEKNPTLKILNTPFKTESYAIILPKENNELMEKINTVIDDIHNEKLYERIYNTYVTHTDNYHYTAVNNDGPEFIIATSPDFPPYEYYENNEIVGIEIELAKIIADRLHMKLKIESMEFDSIINAVSSGKVHAGFSGFSKTEERAKVINFTHTICSSQIFVIVPDHSKTSVQNHSSFTDKFSNNFIKEDRWKMLVSGLMTTIIISVFSAIIGLLGGTVMAVIRIMNNRTGNFRILNFLIRMYVNIIRGTPVMVQLLIIYYIIFASVDISKIVVAIVAFGLNSMAYTEEIIRAGMKSVPTGQFEAGYALGLKPFTIIRHIILPQAFKNNLPALANEGISLIKETSICGYIGLMDLTRGGVVIRNTTFEAFMPLLAVALIYLAIIGTLSACVARLERNLKKNER
ncbi:ABC transporter substrate-binding protein/permease [Ruminobacter sp.]|uniref:ABC transporter substrate-binding protein/permease n=1 Tax=Ruminobacter sp. TaxID=2774296 RepID=UPI002579F33F|nr:ABC transporter substrate-binding protein/permease [Ruminobacter sp.]